MHRNIGRIATLLSTCDQGIGTAQGTATVGGNTVAGAQESLPSAPPPPIRPAQQQTATTSQVNTEQNETVVAATTRQEIDVCSRNGVELIPLHNNSESDHCMITVICAILLPILLIHGLIQAMRGSTAWTIVFILFFAPFMGLAWYHFFATHGWNAELGCWLGIAFVLFGGVRRIMSRRENDHDKEIQAMKFQARLNAEAMVAATSK
jgi:membrane protein implicated in regulation of membrane protease activity